MPTPPPPQQSGKRKRDSDSTSLSGYYPTSNLRGNELEAGSQTPQQSASTDLDASAAKYRDRVDTPQGAAPGSTMPHRQAQVNNNILYQGPLARDNPRDNTGNAPSPVGPGAAGIESSMHSFDPFKRMKFAAAIDRESVAKVVNNAANTSANANTNTTAIKGTKYSLGFPHSTGAFTYCQIGPPPGRPEGCTEAERCGWDLVGWYYEGVHDECPIWVAHRHQKAGYVQMDSVLDVARLMKGPSWDPQTQPLRPTGESRRSTAQTTSTKQSDDATAAVAVEDRAAYLGREAESRYDGAVGNW
ncbi:hypothetical protein BJ170DRAFT_406258 [Xylariales sp. AK1849]|nr:hypothetical protein BJ170DRAFT_406258 [Xylariales sp. AK1849]